MTKVQLDKLYDIIRDKTTGRTSVMEFIGNTAIEDIRHFVKNNDRLPLPKEIVDQYLTLPHFENILGVGEVTVPEVEKFIGYLLKEADEEDFQVARVK